MPINDAFRQALISPPIFSSRPLLLYGKCNRQYHAPVLPLARLTPACGGADAGPQVRFCNADSPPPFPADGNPKDETLLDQWTDLAAASLEIEIIPSEWKYSETAEMLRCIGPALIRLPGEDDGDRRSRFLAVLKGGRRSLTVLTPDLQRRRIPQAAVRDALTRSLREEAAGPTSRILKKAGISAERG